MISRAVAFCLCLSLLIITACTPSGGVTTDAPTRVLIPAEPTRTPIPTVTPTPTVPNLISAAELQLTNTAQATPDATQEALQPYQAVIDLAREGIVTQIQPDNPDQLEFISVEEQQWSNTTLDCGNQATVNDDSEPVDGFKLLWLYDETVYEVHTDADQTARVCFQGSIYDDYPALYMERDFSAAELVFIATNRLGDELDLSTRLIEVVSVRPVTWEDASLGCPLEDQTYAQALTPGYRIVLTAGESEYVYHTDFEFVLRCDEASDE